jgi:hypothetical protein
MLVGLNGASVSEVILKPEGGKGEDVSEAFGEGRWDGERMTTGAVTGYFMWMNADVVNPHREGSR